MSSPRPPWAPPGRPPPAALPHAVTSATTRAPPPAPPAAPPRPPPAGELAQSRHARPHPVALLRPAGGNPETRHYLVEDQDDAVLLRKLPPAREGARSEE